MLSPASLLGFRKKCLEMGQIQRETCNHKLTEHSLQWPGFDSSVDLLLDVIPHQTNKHLKTDFFTFQDIAKFGALNAFNLYRVKVHTVYLVQVSK